MPLVAYIVSHGDWMAVYAVHNLRGRSFDGRDVTVDGSSMFDGSSVSVFTEKRKYRMFLLCLIDVRSVSQFAAP